MSEIPPDATKDKSTKKAEPHRVRKIRIIGGPAFVPPSDPELDIRQVPFTLDGLSSVAGLEDADTIIYWPSKTLFDDKVIANELIRLFQLVDADSPPPHILGLPLDFEYVPLDSLQLKSSVEDGFCPYGAPVLFDTVENGQVQSGKQIEAFKAFRLTPHPKVISPFTPLIYAIRNHIDYVHAYMDSVQKGEWKDYHKRTRCKDPQMFIAMLIGAALKPAFAAVSNGASVAVVVPNDFTPEMTINEDSLLPYDFCSAFAWLSQTLIYFWNGEGNIQVNTSAVKHASEHFCRMLHIWSTLDANTRITFAVGKKLPAERLAITTSGIDSDNAFSPTILDPIPHLSTIQAVRNAGISSPDAERKSLAMQYFPARIDAAGNALNLVFRHGTGGFVLMSEPSSMEQLLGIHTDGVPFRRIELTNRRVSIKGQQDEGYIVEVTPSSGAKSDVPMTVSTFRRFLAFCVAAELASSTGQSGTIDLTKMTVGKHDLSGVVDPVKQGQGHKPGQLIQEAFKDALKSKYSLIQSSPDREKDARRLHPDFWNIVAFDKLMKQVLNPRKTDTENEDALRKIFSALKQP